MIDFGPFRMDTAKRVLWRGTDVVPLPPKALDLLASLVEQQGDVVRKEDLMARVWPDTFVEEANLSVNVSILRRVLGEREDGGPYIQTIPRRGYRFVAAATAPGGGLPSLAVLPFKELGTETDGAFLGVGMADTLITRLGRTGQVVVRPTGAVLKYGASGIDPREVGRELRVDAVLDGTIQRHGDRLRVNVQLVPMGGSLPAWSQKFDAEKTDVFAVQDAVAEQVAAALALRLGAPEKVLLVERPTQDLLAYEACAKGRYFWSRLTGASMAKAFACFQEAAERDPGYALPHAGLAEGYLVLGFSGLVPPREAWPLALASARRALDLDETVAEAHLCLAYVSLFQDWDWPAATAALQRALALEANSPAAHQWYGLYLDLLGRFDEATHAIERARALDPVSLIVGTMMGLQLLLAGDFEGEREQHRRTVELDPNQFLGHWGLGLACAHLGRHEEARAELQQAAALADGSAFIKAALAWSLAVAGQGEEARTLVGELLSAGSYVSSYQRATIHAALDEREQALACLEAACEERDPWVVWLVVDPMLDTLRAEPRLQALIARVFASAPR